MARGLVQHVTRRSATLILFESSLILAAVMLSVPIRLGRESLTSENFLTVLPRALLIACVSQVCLYYRDLYDDPHIAGDRRELLVRLLQALGSASLILAALYFWFPTLIIGRGIFAVAAFLVVTFVIGWRVAFLWFSGKVGPRERFLLVGTSAAGLDLARELHQRRELGVEIVGFVDSDVTKVGIPLFNPSIIGTLDDIPAIVRARSVDRVVVNLADARGKLPMDKLLEMKLDGVQFEHLTTVYEDYTGKIAVENLRPSWLIFSSGFRKTRVLQTMKRLIDIAGGLIGLIISGPIVAVVSVIIKLTAPSDPVFYRQSRVGQHNRVFTLYKLRTMYHNAEARTGVVWSQPGDSRITPFGRFLRKTRLDELPQFWNVLKGDMSLVGPRPERPEFVSSLTQQIPFYGQRHVVKPGLTGWAQVRYSYGASVEDSLEKLQYDLFYIKNLSIALDFCVILETTKTVLLGRGQ
jgi:sugar transferase (PEP-CTERM system associated)